MPSTRDRLVQVSMRLFGEKGYAATTVAQIEAAAGLSPGSGGLYRHFRSKEDLLRAGLESVLTPPVRLPSLGTDPDIPRPPLSDVQSSPRTPAGKKVPAPDPPIEAVLEGIAKTGLARLQHDRDFNRILVRDLRTVPALLEMSADREIRPVHSALAALLADAGLPAGVDPTAAAAVLIGALSHFWLFVDIFGQHPAGVSEDAFITALVRMASAIISKEAS